jgi:virulence factor Mce-like protein
MGGAVALTALFLTGSIKSATQTTFADFENCGQGLRVGGDVKLRGVLIGRIEGIERISGGDCRVKMGLFPADVDQIPANVGAQVRAKTVFGEKWVELTYPDSPEEPRIAAGDIIPTERTIDPLEVETILNTALPLLDAIDPEHLSGALTALAEGFVDHEDAAIEGIEKGIEALRPLNENEALLEEGLTQLADSAEVFENVDDDLLEAFANLDRLNRFTVSRSDLLAENLQRAPVLMRELSSLFEVRFLDLTKLVDRGATVVGVLAAHSEDLDQLLNVLPTFNSNWIRNLNAVCRFRQQTDEPGKASGDRVPGRCWRVHNVISHSRGPYGPKEGPRPRTFNDADYRDIGLSEVTDLGKLLYAPAIGGAL